MAPTRDVLLKAKCKALARSRWGDVADAPGATHVGFPGGAALAVDDTAWFLAEDDPRRSLGGAIVWARRHHAKHLHLLATADTGTLARRAEHFATAVDVWRIDGTTLSPATPDPPPRSHDEDDPRIAPFRVLFDRAGADSVVEDGLLRAEVRGLEVARVEVDAETGEPRLAVGVGKHDREAQREVHGRDQGFDHLFEVVRIVAEHRVAQGLGHAAFHLSPERWLRSVILRNPGLVGAADDLTPAPSPTTRDDLRQPAAAPARGTDRDTGAPLLVVCSVGANLDLVPEAVDAWLADDRTPRPHVRLVVPEGDDHPATHDLVADLRLPADLVTVPPDWRAR